MTPPPDIRAEFKEWWIANMEGKSISAVDAARLAWDAALANIPLSAAVAVVRKAWYAVDHKPDCDLKVGFFAHHPGRCTCGLSAAKEPSNG